MDDLVERLRKRAEIRRTIVSRWRPERDRLSDLLDEAAAEIEKLRKELQDKHSGT